MNTLRSLPYDTRTLDVDGLPHLGVGEQFFHASFEVAGETNFVEGVVCAANGDSAVSLLLAAEARDRLTAYSTLRERALHPLVRRLERAEAQLLLPKVKHRVSMWKAPVAA